MSPLPDAVIQGAASRRLPIARLMLCAALGLGLLLSAKGFWILAKAQIAQILLDRAFSQALVTRQPVKPWPWADSWPVARIEVPRLGVSQIVLDGDSGQALAFAPGHLRQSGEPGSADTAVYAAHRDTHFGFLGALVRGDLIRVTRADGASFTYKMTDARVLRWNGFAIDRHPPRPMLALATCWPLAAIRRGPWRYVVSAELTQDAAATGRIDPTGR